MVVLPAVGHRQLSWERILFYECPEHQCSLPRNKLRKGEGLAQEEAGREYFVSSSTRRWKMPRDSDLGLYRIENRAGLAISVLPNGCIFAIEHRREDATTMINQLLGSPVDGGAGRIYLRIGGAAPATIEAAGPGANVRLGAVEDRLMWEGETYGLRHRVTLMLHPQSAAWLWRLDVTNSDETARPVDAILIQDLGLGDRGFLMNSEAYASQYIDHHIARHERYGLVVMSRQNLTQGGRNPWSAHGCLDGASGFATDGIQLFGPAFRDGKAFGFPFGTPLPNARLQ
jgi:1,2-beta-oligoglucan phosphorylase